MRVFIWKTYSGKCTRPSPGWSPPLFVYWDVLMVYHSSVLTQCSSGSGETGSTSVYLISETEIQKAWNSLMTL